MQKTQMSDRDDNDEIIKNEETQTRRAWVERAIASVRRRLERGDGLPPASKETDRAPHLYVVPPNREP